MFTGIIDHVGQINSVEKMSGGLRLSIQTHFRQFVQGESIAVDGICLTVTTFEATHFFCDLSPETLACTTAHSFLKGQKVNLERALRVGDSMGGHWVNGHIDQTATVAALEKKENFLWMRFSLASHTALDMLIPKGCIAINGVSLTVNQLYPDGFDVMLIPETLAKTNLSVLQAGDSVNIEIDWMSKLMVKQCQSWQMKQIS